MALKLPTPPTPPTIDKGEAADSAPRIDAHQFFEVPFKREDFQPKIETEEKTVAEVQEKPVEKKVEKPAENTPPQISERKVTTPEDMARESVANGGGALTKKTITRPENEPPATQNVPVASEKSNKGKEILREFQEEDRQLNQMQTVTEKPRTLNQNQGESYSGIYWIVMLVLVGILSVVFVRKVLVKKNPALKKSDLFEDSSQRLKAVSEKVSAPSIKKSPPKKDDDKGKHFEARI